MFTSRLRQNWLYLALSTIVIVGWGLRLTGLDWDQGYGLHPDERYITWVAANLHLPDRWNDLLNPHRTSVNPYMWPPNENDKPGLDRARPFSYGHLPLYLMAVTSGGSSDEADLGLVGRVLSALFDTALILLVFALGRETYDARTGLLAASFVAFTVMNIQLAHFGTFDTILAFFTVATLLFASRFARARRKQNALMAGLWLGFALGSKFSAVLLLFPLAMAFALASQLRDQRDSWREWRLFLLTIVVAFFTFALTNPFSLIQPHEFLANLRTQSAMLQGDPNFPFTQQYRDTLPYLYHIGQQVRWGMGPPLGLAAFGGLAFALLNAWRSPQRPDLWIPLVWVLVYFGFVGSLQVKFMRYMLPVTPVLAVFGAAMLVKTAASVAHAGMQGGERNRDSSSEPRTRRSIRLRLDIVRHSLAGLVCLASLLYALAFVNVYRGEHPWLRLSRWMYDNIPPRSTVAYERWDHQLPLSLVHVDETRWPGEFRQLALDPYALESPEDVHKALENLAASDYLVLASNRLYGSATRWPERYPWTGEFYERLFHGDLGFNLIALPDFERHPQLGPVALIADPVRTAGFATPDASSQSSRAALTIDLGRADESFTVYDHPRPLLFRNTERLTATEMGRTLEGLLATGAQ
jgi:hypothetical protein